MKSSLWILIIILSILTVIPPVIAQEESLYRIKPTDLLNIYVHENNDLSLTVTVLPDGTISYPLVGSLYVQGLSPEGLQTILTEKLRQFLQNPVVVVTISSQTTYKVFLLGQVSRPGQYPYENGRRLTDYIALAGGTAEKANLKKCHIYSVKANEASRIVNLKELFEDYNHVDNIKLLPDDTVMLQKKADFFIDEWNEIAQIMSIIVGSATLYFIITRD